ncbi:hypothetical protein DFJ58DRAFT_733058 [Suillus subalutaceus]|uniref:uncharacterized protein n=1 Tax=Suillus subalutaceus TaxID=48586 RepID=UPI001B866E63|nr:uncharacterized protein DFJ58DRAFT_733058 [Suillus subalutaceus]KAG1839961.1 hypothetical protein DFJ58DRAFT_733058 [Suillus subalutaceus]
MRSIPTQRAAFPHAHLARFLTLKRPASPIIQEHPSMSMRLIDVFEAAIIDDGRSLKMMFEEVYGPNVRFCASTFSDHLKRWKAAPPSSRVEIIEAGKTDDGLYSKFMKENHAPGGEVKAARKCLACLHG